MPWRALLFALTLLAMSGPAAAGETAHTARPGDNPAALAKRYHVPVAAILARNPGLDPGRIKVGDVIVIPDAPATPGPLPPNGSAAKAALAPPTPAASGLDTPDAPAPAAASPASGPSAGPSAKNSAAPKTASPSAAGGLPDEEAPGRRYVVAPGDFPAAIAERFGIPLEVLERANPGLDPKRLPVGCVLTVPEGNACAPPAVAVTRPGEPGSTAPLMMDFQ